MGAILLDNDDVLTCDNIKCWECTYVSRYMPHVGWRAEWFVMMLGTQYWKEEYESET